MRNNIKQGGKWLKKAVNAEVIFSEGFQGFSKYTHYDPDIEEAILGIVLLRHNTSMAKVRRILKPEMFYGDWNKHVYAAMVEMYDQSAQIDLMTVNSWIHRYPPDHPIWPYCNYGASAPWMLTKMTCAVVQDVHLEYWCFIIRELYIERMLMYLTTAGMTGMTSREKMQEIQKKINDLLQYKHTEDWEHISSLLVKLWQHMEEVRGLDMIGVPFGFPGLDKITSGIQEGLYYLAARPSVGKTALAAKIVMKQAAAGFPVGVVSLETKGMKLVARILSIASNIPYFQIIRAMLDEQGERNLFSYAQVLSEYPIYISDEPAVTTADIRGKVLKLIFDHGCRIIWIDYIQLVEPDEAGNREQEVAKMSRDLKLLSMQTGIPIVALAQLSRESEKRSGEAKKPRLIDLRESGSLEQDADGVMLLHRDEKVGILEDSEGNSTVGQADFIVAKWRDGETFTHPLTFIGSRMEFIEREGSDPFPTYRPSYSTPYESNKKEEEGF